MKAEANFALVIHGGAGPLTRDLMTKDLEGKYEAKLKQALELGYKMLKEKASSLNVVEAVINVMEDSTLFDAGKGSVVNEKGEVEMDSSIMEGNEYKAGSVACVKQIKHPISLARKVMENSPHVMLFGEGADNFGIKCGLETVTKDYFFSEPRYWEDLEIKYNLEKNRKLGTVGAVALDCTGRISAGCSTGGTLKKMQGRVGDSPIIGSGTYADSKTCGVACTGTGEYFIRGVVAHSVSLCYEYKQVSIQNAVEHVLKEKVEKMGGDGGIIAMDKDGNVGMVYNTRGMFRGHISKDGMPHVFIDKT